MLKALKFGFFVENPLFLQPSITSKNMASMYQQNWKQFFNDHELDDDTQQALNAVIDGMTLEDQIEIQDLFKKFFDVILIEKLIKINYIMVLFLILYIDSVYILFVFNAFRH